MSNIIKTVFKLLLCTIVYTVVFIVINGLMPFSEGLKALNASAPNDNPFFLLLIAALACFTIFYIIRNTNYRGGKLFLNIVFVLFFVQYFMAQIETLLFGHAFPVLTVLDVILIMLAGLLQLLAITPLMIKFFQNKDGIDGVIEKKHIEIKSLIKKLCILGVVYTGVYMFFGYFVAWQFEALRVFYTGSPEKLSFWGQLINNAGTNPIIYPFQFLRGILFGIFVLPLMNMTSTKKVFTISVSLVFLYLGYIFILPNPLFPDMVRLGHFLEMTTSMLFFGSITGRILWQENTAEDSKGI